MLDDFSGVALIAKIDKKLDLPFVVDDFGAVI